MYAHVPSVEIRSKRNQNHRECFWKIIKYRPVSEAHDIFPYGTEKMSNHTYVRLKVVDT
jgi:hypothetical protein